MIHLKSPIRNHSDMGKQPQKNKLKPKNRKRFKKGNQPMINVKNGDFTNITNQKLPAHNKLVEEI